MPFRLAPRPLPLVLGLAILAAPACAPAGMAPAPGASAPAATASTAPAGPAGQAAPLHRQAADRLPTDQDADGVPDDHERALGLDPASAQPDADADGLPDALEATLGTDPKKRDTDGDGLTDLYEHANPHPAHKAAHPKAPGVVIAAGMVAAGGGNLALAQAGAHTDSDGDGTHNALDADGNNDGVPDAQEDFDGDGIPNALEHAGYYWDDAAKQFKAVAPGDGRVGYKTDPTRKHSDYDPYDDGVEAKGYGIAGVNELNPCKTLYPEISMEVTQVVWTPNGQITFESGESVSTETTQETSTEDSTTTETSSSISSTTTVEASVTAGTDGVNGTASVSEAVEYAESTTNSRTTSSTVSNSATQGSSRDWSTATATDLANAASLKLRVRFENAGALQLIDVAPTVDVKIGDRPVFTLKPTTTINALGTSANNNHFEMTISADDQGNPLTLNLEELKMLQAGAPLRATLTQFAGAIQAQDPAQPDVLAYKTIGQWYQYQDSIDHNTAEILLDDGAGKVTHTRIYAPQLSATTSPPEVTLQDAMAWAFGGKVQDGKLRLVPDPADPDTTAGIADWMFFVNKRIYNLVASTPALQGNMLAVPLRGGTDALLAKAAPTQDFQKYPRLIYLDRAEGRPDMKLVAQDYVGVRSVALRGARDLYDQKATFRAPSPYADPKAGLVHYLGTREFLGQFITDERQAIPAGAKVITSHQKGSDPRAIEPLTLAKVGTGDQLDLAALGWTGRAPHGRRERVYVGPKVEMKGLRASRGERWASLLERNRRLTEPYPATISATERADLDAAAAKLKAMAAQTLIANQEDQVIVVTNTRGRVSVFDALGNLLRFEGE